MSATRAKPAHRVAGNAITNGRRATDRAEAREAFRVALMNGTAEQRGVAADGLERLQLLDLFDEAARWLAALRAIAPKTAIEYLDDPATRESLARRFYAALPVGERWRNDLSRID